MYQYHGFGLCIASEIEFPELLPADFTVAEVTIALGKVAEKLEGDVVIQRPFSSFSKDEFLLDVINISRYYAGYGTEIVAEPAPGIDEHSVRLFLLGTVMAAILYQRGSIPCHASAIVMDGNKLVLFAGDSGAGKSTLLAGLATKGYDIFTDDICVLRQNTAEDKRVTGTASYPMIKLWEDAITQLDNSLFNKDFTIRPQLSKYGQFFYDKFSLESLPVDKIFILTAVPGTDKITINKLGSIEAFIQMEKQAYKYQLISNTELRSAHFSILSQLISQAAVFEVIRPANGSQPGLLLDAIETMI